MFNDVVVDSKDGTKEKGLEKKSWSQSGSRLLVVHVSSSSTSFPLFSEQSLKKSVVFIDRY